MVVSDDHYVHVSLILCVVLIVCLMIFSLDIPGMGHSGMSVNMMVSSEGIKLTSIENGRVIANHDMQGISFASGGEKVLGTLYNVLFQGSSQIPFSYLGCLGWSHKYPNSGASIKPRAMSVPKKYV